MQDRYALRFETGEREGEVLSLKEGTTSVGRRPGNELQILDASVSSKHAELIVDERGVLLRDAGSTNGTRVAGERVLETRLAHGDEVSFGNVRLAFLDRSLSEPARAPAGERAEDALGRVSSEQLARSRRRPRLGLVLGLLVLAGAGGAAWWLLRGRGGDGERTPLRAVVAVAGNALQDGSFEQEGDGFAAEAEAPAAFSESERARHSGRVGQGVELAAGEWALARSPAVRVVSGRRVEARAALRARGGARVLLGIELVGEARGSEPAPGPAHAWGALLEAQDGWEERTLACLVPPGYAQARLVVRASAPTTVATVATVATMAASAGEGEEGTGEGGGGAASFDDVVLLEQAAAGAPALAQAEHRLYLLGEPAREAVLYHVDHLLLTGLGFVARSEGALDEPLQLELAADDVGARLAPLARSGAERGAPGSSPRLVLRVEPVLLAGGLGTLGEGGWRAHGASFEREDADSVLLGAEHRLVALRFERPVSVRGVADGEGARLEIALAPGAGAHLQLEFQNERRATDELARQAREAQARGELGRALSSWQQLVERSPYEPALVREAEAARAKLVDQGLAEVARIADEVERARFFDLADLFRRCRSEVEAVGRRYAGSEVEEAAGELARTIDAELGARASELDGGEDRRLARIEAALHEQGAKQLAEAVASWRAERKRRDAGAPEGEGAGAPGGQGAGAPGGGR